MIRKRKLKFSNSYPVIQWTMICLNVYHWDNKTLHLFFIFLYVEILKSKRNHYCPREIDLQDKSSFILFIGPGTDIFFNASILLFSFLFISLWIKGIFLLITGASKTTINGLMKQGKRSSQNPTIYDLVYTSCFFEGMKK